MAAARNEEPSTCSILNLLTVLYGVLHVAIFVSAAMLLIANVWMVVVISPGVDDVTSAMAVVLRIYNAILCVMVILSLFDLEWILSYASFLLTYLGSGLFQVFVGIMTLGSQDTYRMASKKIGNETGIDSENVDIARSVAGWVMVAMGLIYIVFAIFGFPQPKRRSDFVRLSHGSLRGSRSSGLSKV